MFASQVRTWTDKKIYDEYHKAPDLKIVESVVRDMHEDILSVLAPHFDDKVMAHITKILGDWYGFNTNIEFVDEKREQFNAEFRPSEDRIIDTGKVYRHFKGNYYRVTALAVDATTHETQVLYQSLTPSLDKTKQWLFIRPLKEFESEVDHEKYPDVKAKWRFTRCEEAEVKTWGTR